MTRPHHVPDELRAVLASADADAPDASIDRVRARLEAALGPAFAEKPAPARSATSSKAGAVQLAGRGKWLGLGGVVALGIGLGALLLGQPARPESQPVPQPSAAVARLDTADASSQDPQLPPAPPPPDDLQPEALAPEPAPPAAPSLKPRTPRAGLAEELRQLKQIRQEVVASPARALTLADAHARRFPHGTLGPERELLRIDALMRLGRAAEARELARRELAAPSGTPYRARIEKLLSGQ